MYNIEQSVLASILNAWRYTDEQYDKLTSIKLNENMFTGYNKAIARAINKLNEKQEPITELDVMLFLENVSYLKDDFNQVLSKQSLPYNIAMAYLTKIEHDYKLRLAGIIRWIK